MSEGPSESHVGKAYWLTNTPLGLEELLPLMPDTTDAAQSPPDLKLNFVAVQSPKPSDRLSEILGKCGAYGLSATPMDQYQMPKGLARLVETAKSQGLTYIVEATLPGAKPTQVEGELSTIASLAFHPAFFPNKAFYRSAVVTEQADGSYAFKDGVTFEEGQIVD